MSGKDFSFHSKCLYIVVWIGQGDRNNITFDEFTMMFIIYKIVQFSPKQNDSEAKDITLWTDFFLNFCLYISHVFLFGNNQWMTRIL